MLLITGACGAVGRQIIELASQEEREILAIDLPGREKEFYNFPNVIYRGLDLSTIEGLNSIIRLAHEYKVENIINAAAIVDISVNSSRMNYVNHYLPIVLAKLKPRSLVHISTGSIYDVPVGIILEGYPTKSPRECNSLYEATKLAADKGLQEFIKSKKTGSSISIMRPALIYGPRARFLGAALASIPPMLGSLSDSTIGFTGGPETNWVHCEDVARASLFLNDIKESGIFNIADNCSYSFGDTITDYLEAYGLKILFKIPIPPANKLSKLRKVIGNKHLIKSINFPVQLYWSLIKSLYLLEGGLYVSVDKEAIPYAFQNTVFDNSKIKSLGFKFKYIDSKKAIKKTLEWYQENNWIPSTNRN